VNIVGDQATYHRPLDAPLTADTEGWARPVSGWVRTAMSAPAVGADAAAAVQAARAAPGQVATLILPSDTSWDAGGIVAAPLAVPPPATVDAGIIEAIARVLRSGEPALLLLGGKALREAPLAMAGGIIAATGARMLAETSNARISRGRGRMPIERVPYPVDLAIAALAGLKHIILVGSKPPVGFFAYPDKPGRMYPADCTLHILSRPDQDGPGALASLAAALDARPAVAPAPRAPALLPDNAIVVDESVSFGRGLFPLTHAAAPHDWLHLTGGAIGEGLPMSVGAAVAAPGRRVVTLQADGSAMYTVQALWTQARERLDITTVILANRKYAILLGELAGVGANPGRTALDMMDLANPALDWCSIANGMGVEAAKAETLEQFADLLRHSTQRSGPFLIELMI
jgi:acetolactate synthase-1/2/3 large subunit